WSGRSASRSSRAGSPGRRTPTSATRSTPRSGSSGTAGSSSGCSRSGSATRWRSRRRGTCRPARSDRRRPGRAPDRDPASPRPRPGGPGPGQAPGRRHRRAGRAGGGRRAAVNLELRHAVQALPLRGALVTLETSLLAIVLGIVVGVALTVLRQARVRPVEWACQVYMSVMRGTPLFIQILIVYYVLPGLGFDIP